MWPKERILYLAPAGLAESSGMLSLLKALHKDVVVKEPSAANGEPLEGWFYESPAEGDSYTTPVTEILYWSGIDEKNSCRQWGVSLGMQQRTLPEFLADLWEGCLILSAENRCREAEPLLYRLLKEAGFEPSLLWKTGEGRWETVINLGIHWVVEKEFFDAYTAEGGEVRETQEHICCKEHRQRGTLDFYARQDGAFIGSLPLSLGEETLHQDVSKALGLGVPWCCIERAIVMETGNGNDTERVAREVGI